MSTPKPINIGQDYETKYGFHDPEKYIFKAQKGLTARGVEEISEMKKEPDWMRQFRLKSLEHFNRKPLPGWADVAMLSQINFDNIHYYLKPTDK